MDTPGAPGDTDGLQQQFEAFHAANPKVYATLERLAGRWLDGHRKVGLKMLWEVARWQLGVEATDISVYRLNNNYPSRYARLLLAEHPEWEGRIETRALRAA